MPGSVGEALALSRQEAGELSPHLNATRLDLAGVQVTASAAELNKADGKTGGLVESIEVTFTEDASSTSHVGDVTVPAGATILDIVVQNVALWTGGTAVMKVGDAGDDDGFYTAVDLKATDLLAGETLSFAAAGGVEGAFFVGTLTHITGLYSASARVIKGTITVGTPATTAGRTRMIVTFVLPVSSAAVVS